MTNKSKSDERVEQGKVYKCFTEWVDEIAAISSRMEVVPKWRWFKPPRWKIFKWAYKTCLKPNCNQRRYDGLSALANIFALGEGYDLEGYTEKPEHPSDGPEVDRVYIIPGEDRNVNAIYITITQSPELSPRWEWFNPPRWKIFRWAFHHKIEKAILWKDGYPASTSTGSPMDEDREMTINFKSNPYGFKKEESNVKVSEQTTK